MDKNMLSTITHDLRGQVANILGFTELLADHLQNNLDEKTKHYLEVIKSSATRLNQMIEAISTLEHLNRADLNIQSIDLDVMIEEIIHKVKSENPKRRILWEKDPLPKIKGDPNLLKIAFQSLIENAVQFTEEKENAKIEIGVQPNNKNKTKNSRFCIYIKDNGLGFDNHRGENLFKLFKTLHATGDPKNLGVGLVKAKIIVEKHGGHIDAQGIEGEGAVFVICLPS